MPNLRDRFLASAPDPAESPRDTRSPTYRWQPPAGYYPDVILEGDGKRAADPSTIGAEANFRTFYRTGLKTANLYFVTREMADVALQAAAGVSYIDMDKAPVYNGVIGIEGEGMWVDRSAEHLPPFLVKAIAWTFMPVRRPSRYRVVSLSIQGHEHGVIYRPFHVSLALSPVLWVDSSLREKEWLLTPRSIWRWLGAAWELMQTPTVSETSKLPVPAKVAKKRAKKGREVPPVRIVNLRPLRNEHVTHSPSGRRYTHRWLVRGHWRNQACGPKRAERKRIWVPAYTKGPDGAPLIGGDVVKVWKR